MFEPTARTGVVDSLHDGRTICATPEQPTRESFNALNHPS
jgi:hypothetical protein